MNRFVRGQRWVSDAEADQGLGTVIEADHRTVTLFFPATGEQRTYAIETAPLTRALFTPGSQVVSEDGWSMKVTGVEERDGLLTYVGLTEQGDRAELPETALDNQLRLNRPADRLLSLRIDAAKWFELRYQTLREVNRLARSGLWGLTGGRASLIPHQLYIAHEVASRYAPRVLLADEVGLGKTIEAGMILHHQLLLERARRVLIVTPPTLVHQWLVEMLRRFNLSFSIFDEPRWRALREESGNPFDSEQRVLCSLDFLTDDPARLAAAVASDWDLLVVDEAHHLEWREDEASPGYKAVEQLAKVAPGVLLLTATPEQLGKAAHFARLRLLDPDRYPDLASFVREEEAFEPVADAIEALLDDAPLPPAARETLEATLVEGDNLAWLKRLESPAASEADKAAARESLVAHLLDRHGTGRVLFRNTRAAVKGFPDRRLEACPLPCPDEYRVLYAERDGQADAARLVAPELAWQSKNSAEPGGWTRFDPRVAWLLERLRDLGDEKILLIAAHLDTVLDLANALRLRSGVHAAVFHENMSIVERDRAAAFFADPEEGTQILICSEIGSEGRNFQFAHHLILFDLPVNPDLLEQRIGRLDRIGQAETIHIHVPFLEETPQQTLFDWHHRGLGAFEAPCPAAHGVFSATRDELWAALSGQGDASALIDRTAQLTREMNQALHQGRDRLLEIN
ncbi:MAG TPA: RNA polymerase-associated protein RapA, partial [Gammaproteobacteria bacterium]|nr:RNA polymerase-associated protein RapA [Gammaproteobacteria bacterium]